MKAYLKGVLALAACSIMAFASTAQAKEWYEGGTLHKASVAQWHQADEHNRIATAGDWVHATTSRKYIDLIFDEDPEIMHMAAKMVAQCVTTSTEDMKSSKDNASTYAVLCMGMLKAVSYTHLDVYKRQRIYNIQCKKIYKKRNK